MAAKIHRSRVGAFLAATLLLAAGSPAAGDWLVTREGARVETRGPWKMKGKLVVFMDKDGRLASLRGTEVDLPASEKATRDSVEEEARKRDAPPPPEPPRRKSVRIVTDADVAHVEPAGVDKDGKDEEGDEEGKEPAESDTERPLAGNSVVVSTWDRRDLATKDGLEIVGELRNNGSEMATGLRVTIAIYDEAKEVLGSDDAILSATALQPGSKATFRAPFPGLYSYADVQFNVQSFGLKLKPVKPTEGDGHERVAPPP